MSLLGRAAAEGEIGFRSYDQEVVLGPGGYIVKPRGEVRDVDRRLDPRPMRAGPPGPRSPSSQLVTSCRSPSPSGCRT